MTVEEIIEHEGRSGHLCLMLQGMFMRAYNGSAQTLARLTGYRLKRHSLWSPGMLLRFSLRAIGARQRTHYRCGRDSRKPREWLCRVFGSGRVVRRFRRAFAALAGAAQEKGCDARGWRRVGAALAAFDLARATPLEAMNFVGELQRQLFAAEVND